MEVNGTSFSQITHAEAVTIMRNAWNIIMIVQSASPNGEKQEALHIKEIEMVVFPSSSNEYTLGCATTRQVYSVNVWRDEIPEIQKNSYVMATIEKKTCSAFLDLIVDNSITRK